MERNIISCPICGQEYVPSEIFIPKAFFGEPKEVLKDAAGRVEFVVGSDMDLSETFTCEHCGKEFSVQATVSFTTKPIGEEKTFEEEYISRISHPKRVNLEEESLFEQ